MSSIVKGQPKDSVYTVEVDVDGKMETVTVHPEKGPLVRNADGSTTNFIFSQNTLWNNFGPSGQPKKNKVWTQMKVTEQEVMLHTVAKKNLKLREWEQASPGGKVDTQTPAFLVNVIKELERQKQNKQMGRLQDATDWAS